MFVYWSVCLISMFLCIGMTHTTQYRKKQFFFPILLSGFPMFLVSALRYGIGTDYFEYVSMYDLYFSRGERVNIEPIFYSINKFVADLKWDVQWVFVICAAVYVYAIFTYIFLESKDMALSVFLLVGMTYYMSSFNTMRQHVATALCLLSIYYLKKKKYVLFIGFVLVATGIHYSVIIFIVAICFMFIKINTRKALVFTAGYVVVIPIVVSLIRQILASTKYVKYLYTPEFSIASLLGIALQVVILVFASIFYAKDDEEYRLYYGLQLIATWITMLGNYVSLAGRVKWLFGVPTIVFIPLILSKIKNKKMKLIFEFGIYLLFFIYAQVVVGMMKSYGVIPYKSILGV